MNGSMNEWEGRTAVEGFNTFGEFFLSLCFFNYNKEKMQKEAVGKQISSRFEVFLWAKFKK